MPKAGDFFVTATEGFWPAIMRLVCGTPVNHAGICVGGTICIEGKPSGAVYVDAANYPDAIWHSPNLTSTQRSAISMAAPKYLGMTFTPIDLVAMLFYRKFGYDTIDHEKPLHRQPWYVKRLAQNGTATPSQLVDMQLRDAGITLFPQKIAGLVLPADLLQITEEGPQT